jgi:predicted phosphodiesterase
MRFLILSDIHGNRFGLESVLANASGEYDTLLCLGDVVGYGAHPNECCEILRQHNAVSLSGNHDAAALGLIDIDWFNPVAKAAILWTRAQLSDTNRDWLHTLPAQQDWPEHDFQTVHGSLREPWEEYITGPSVAEPVFLLMQHTLCFFGHTHVAFC